MDNDFNGGALVGFAWAAAIEAGIVAAFVLLF